MGYYSSFEVIDTDFDLEELHDLLEEYSDYTFVIYGGVLRSTDQYKWYGWLDDLKRIATDYPNNSIEIERIGEESPDIERALAKDGKVRTIEPELVWPNY